MCFEFGFYDIFGLVKIGCGWVDGDILNFVKNLCFFKEVLIFVCVKEELVV